jgi:signal peptidase II
MGRWLFVLAPLAALVGCDHATKHAAKAQLERQPPHQLLGSVLDLRYAENTDVAFNLLRFIPERVRAPLLLVFGGVATLVLLVIVLRRQHSRAAQVAFLLIGAGALGNYLDRLLRGYVVDFIHVPRWPVFNVADIYVTAGALLLVALGRKQRSSPGDQASPG